MPWPPGGGACRSMEHYKREAERVETVEEDIRLYWGVCFSLGAKWMFLCANWGNDHFVPLRHTLDRRCTSRLELVSISHFMFVGSQLNKPTLHELNI